MSTIHHFSGSDSAIYTLHSSPSSFINDENIKMRTITMFFFFTAEKKRKYTEYNRSSVITHILYSTIGMKNKNTWNDAQSISFRGEKRERFSGYEKMRLAEQVIAYLLHIIMKAYSINYSFGMQITRNWFCRYWSNPQPPLIPHRLAFMQSLCMSNENGS